MYEESIATLENLGTTSATLYNSFKDVIACTYPLISLPLPLSFSYLALDDNAFLEELDEDFLTLPAVTEL